MNSFAKTHCGFLAREGADRKLLVWSIDSHRAGAVVVELRLGVPQHFSLGSTFLRGHLHSAVCLERFSPPLAPHSFSFSPYHAGILKSFKKSKEM